MSTFKAEVVTFSLNKHPNADSLSIAEVKGWNCVVKTDDFKSENPAYKNLGVYIPIDAVAPSDHPLLHFMEGKRVKTVRLRGVYSQGILLPIDKVVNQYLLKKFPQIGDDLTDVLGIKKWEEPVKPKGGSLKNSYDTVKVPDTVSKYTEIERLNNYPSVINEGEEVFITEKLHGANARYSIIDNKFYIGSRNLGIRTEPKTIFVPRFKSKTLNRLVSLLGLQKLIDKKKLLPRPENWWTLADQQNQIEQKLRKLSSSLNGKNVVIYGEVVSQSVQDLGYGYTSGNYGFYAFDIKINNATDYADPRTFETLVKSVGFNTCPLLKVGPFSKEDLNLRLGKTNINEAGHVREGIVIKPTKPRSDPSLGRVILKVISEEYDMRKGAKDN